MADIHDTHIVRVRVADHSKLAIWGEAYPVRVLANEDATDDCMIGRGNDGNVVSRLRGQPELLAIRGYRQSVRVFSFGPNAD